MTMDVLRTFHIMNLQAHVSPTDFYWSLERMTDSQGCTKLPVSVDYNIASQNLRHFVGPAQPVYADGP